MKNFWILRRHTLSHLRARPTKQAHTSRCSQCLAPISSYSVKPWHDARPKQGNRVSGEPDLNQEDTYSSSALGCNAHGLPLGSAGTAHFEDMYSCVHMQSIISEGGQQVALCEQCVAPRTSRIHILLHIMRRWHTTSCLTLTRIFISGIYYCK